MSRCYYVKSEDPINLEALSDMIQDKLKNGFKVRMKYLNEKKETACFYIEGQAARGIYVSHDDDCIVVEIQSLCNYADYAIAKVILYLLKIYIDENVTDEEGKLLDPKDYFTDEKIEELREEDAKRFLAELKTIEDDCLQIPGVIRSVYLGKKMTGELLQYENEPQTLVRAFNSIFYSVQYTLPDYRMPGAALIRPQNSENEKDFKQVRILLEGIPYILQDYDYLAINPGQNNDEIIFIDNDDLKEIAAEVFPENSDFGIVDDFTIVFPKLEGAEWKKFVTLAKEKNHKDLLTATEVILKEDEKKVNCQCHGNHWDCIFKGKKKNMFKMITESVEQGHMYKNNICDYNLKDEKIHGKVAMLEYNRGDEDSPVVIRNVIAVAKDNTLSLVSGYPVVKEGRRLSLKITEIIEWENELEAWISAELPDGKNLTFFDSDYAVNKDKYVPGNTYDFNIGALAYSVSEPETKGFTFEGQTAIDFNAKIGQETEYDEDGKVKPIHFSTESLCAFIQTDKVPDDAEFISTVNEVKNVTALGESYWFFNVIYRTDGDDLELPVYALKSSENENIQKANQLKGLLWITGFLLQ